MSIKKASVPIQQPQPIKQITNQRKFQRWTQKNQVNTQTPIQIQESFRNLENPLEYIRDKRIKKLQSQSQHMINQMKFQRQSISEMSKLTYKKVVSRQKIDYQFGNTQSLKNNQYRGYHQHHKRQAKKKQLNTKAIKKRDQLTKQFIHDYNRVELDNKIQHKKLTLDVIRDIDNKDFENKHQNVEYFDIFVKNEEQKLPSTFPDISENYQMDELFGKLSFNIIDRDSYYSQKSAQYLFKPDEQLDFWRRFTNQNMQIAYGDQIQIMKRCHNFDPNQPSFLHLLDFAAGKLDGQILSSYFKLKAKHEAQLKINQNDENLQQEYNRKKQQYDFLRQMKMKDKNQRIAIKYAKNTAQTIDNLQDISFDSYFQQSARDLILNIKELNQIRDAVMQKNQKLDTKKTMLVNIGHEIKNLSFKLLSLILKGETFANYEQIISIGQQITAQKKILQIVYHEFHKIQLLEVDSIPKTKILDIYLQQRQKNQRMFQLLGRVYGQDKPKAVTIRKTKPKTQTKK